MDDAVARIGQGYDEPVEPIHRPIGGKLHRVAFHLGKPQITVALDGNRDDS
jgi:hypothetical protein